MSRPILYAVLIMALPFAFACETPSSHMAEKFGDSVADAREKMLAEHVPPSPLEGMAGPTSERIVENYHYNQDSENRQEAMKETGLVDMDSN